MHRWSSPGAEPHHSAPVQTPRQHREAFTPPLNPKARPRHRARDVKRFRRRSSIKPRAQLKAIYLNLLQAA